LKNKTNKSITYLITAILIADAPVLVLDEPTSGLDAYGANQLVKLLSELSSNGNRIVILSIHQPSMKAFMEMDQVLLLGHGRVMYSGRPADVADYLGGLGFPCPPLETIADHMLDIVSDSNNHEFLKAGETTWSKYTRLESEETPEDGVNPTAYLARSTCMEDNSDDNRSKRPDGRTERYSRVNEIGVLFLRTARDIFRNKELFMMQMSISFALALFGGGIFNDVSNNLAGFQNRMGVSTLRLPFRVSVVH
jgi:ATP-binding cassette, subfamily G (WHITE), member 2